MCHSCTNTRLSQRHNNFSYFYRRRFLNDADRKDFYVGLLDEIAGCDLDLATKFSSYIAVIQDDFQDRLPEWLQHPLERLKLKEAFRYFLTQSCSKDSTSRQILEKLTRNLPQYIIDELIDCAKDLPHTTSSYITLLKRRSINNWSRSSSIIRLETVA
ncbi:uncharacterized protein [Atheta coriaria]|uniref:uncharacterized protein n=1 Tax=Dalotia coriaria TaxID=877792 RepID=UPI0031F43935